MVRNNQKATELLRLQLYYILIVYNYNFLLHKCIKQVLGKWGTCEIFVRHSRKPCAIMAHSQNLCAPYRDVFRGPARPGPTNVVGPGQAVARNSFGTISEQ